MKIFAPIIIFLFVSPLPAFAASVANKVEEGNLLYSDQKYAEAAKIYEEAIKKDANSDIINFNLGAALYKTKDYEESIKSLQKSLLTEDRNLKEKTHYNLGNTFYKFGIKKENSSLNEAVASLQQSVDEYEKALTINSKNEDALFNRNLALNELERLKKQQQQDQKQQKKDDQDKNSDSTKSEQSKPDQNQGESPKEDQEQQENQSESKQNDSNQQNSDNKAQKSGEKDRAQQDDKKENFAQDMTKNEAEMLLQGYKQSEEPRGMLNFQPRQSSNRPVLKDW